MLVMLDELLITQLKCSVHLYKIASLPANRVLLFALCNVVTRDLIVPYIGCSVCQKY